ncbi:MAG: tetratricopeptide repeat protein [Deltaproteobacteria bacterium]|nr:tetratricopeptide repeat protein [Kofleriaceae bacterium]
MRSRKCIVALALVASIAAPAAADVADDLKDGDKYFEEKNWKKAAQAYDNAIRSAPNQVPPEAYGNRARIFIIQGDFPAGLEFVRKKAKLTHPEAAEVLEQEALLLWATGDKPGAIAVAEKTVAKKPSAFSNQAILCEFHFNRDPAKTISACEGYLSSRESDLESRDVMPLIRLGFSYLARGARAVRDGKERDATADYENAIKQFERIQRKHPKERYAQPNADIGLCAAYTGLRKFDQAIATCERLQGNPRNVDSNGSVYFNLGTAYLAKRLPQKARQSANEYLKKRKNEPRGHILIGDAYFQEREWAEALRAYLEAEKLMRGGGQQAELSVKLGKTYRRMPSTGTVNTNLTKAIEKLEEGMKASPGSFELGIELGSAYLAARKDQSAESVADKLIASKDFASQSPEVATQLYLVSGKSQYNQKNLTVARQRFEAAVALKPKDVEIRRDLVYAINAQALAAFKKGETKAAVGLLEDAVKADPASPMTVRNMAVIAIDKGDCDAGLRHLARLKDVPSARLDYNRLSGRALLCAKKPDPNKAMDHFAVADEEATKNSANLVKAAIYTEWGPLLMSTKLDDAVEKLDIAVRFSASVPKINNAAKRNLAVALFRRGWRNMKAGKDADAVADLERASRDPSLLKGTETLAFEFSYALALLERGNTDEAGKTFKQLAAKGNQSSYLKSPYDKVGNAFFGAYSDYRSNNAAQRQRAASEFTGILGKASGSFGNTVRALIASSHEYVAYDHWRNGRSGPAGKSLDAADKYATTDEMKRRIINNRAVLSLTASRISTLENLRGSPPEALVNLGILYEQAGKPRDAYDAWRAASGKANARDLQKWIDAKKRIYGF